VKNNSLSNRPSLVKARHTQRRTIPQLVTKSYPNRTNIHRPLFLPLNEKLYNEQLEITI